MSVRIDERGRAHVEPRLFRGQIVAISLVSFIAVFVVVAWSIHTTNLRARAQARDAAEAAEAAELAAPGAPAPAAH